jgi:ribonuclease VapC
VDAGIELVPVTAAQARIAPEAYRRSERATIRPGSIGDCFAYALAKERDLPLLFKGDDFGKADLRPAL